MNQLQSCEYEPRDFNWFTTPGVALSSWFILNVNVLKLLWSFDTRIRYLRIIYISGFVNLGCITQYTEISFKENNIDGMKIFDPIKFLGVFINTVRNSLMLYIVSIVILILSFCNSISHQIRAINAAISFCGWKVI